MQALEVEAKAKDGIITIKIPKKYISIMRDNLRVIILAEESLTEQPKPSKKRILKAVKIKTKGFKFNRDENH